MPRSRSRSRSRSRYPPGIKEAFEGQPSIRADRMLRSRAAKKIQTAQRKRRNKRRTNAARKIQRSIREASTRRLNGLPPSSSSSSSRRSSLPRSSSRRRSSLPRSSSRRSSLPRSSSRRSSLPRSSSRRRSSLSRQNSHQRRDVVQSRQQSVPVRGTLAHSNMNKVSLMRAQAELNRLKEIKAQREREQREREQREQREQNRSQMRGIYGQPMYDKYGSLQYHEDGVFIPPGQRLRRQNAVRESDMGSNNFYKHTRLG